MAGEHPGETRNLVEQIVVAEGAIGLGNRRIMDDRGLVAATGFDMWSLMKAAASSSAAEPWAATDGAGPAPCVGTSFFEEPADARRSLANASTCGDER